MEKKYRDNYFKIIIKNLLILLIILTLIFLSGVLGFKFFYHDWLNQNNQRIEKNIKIDSEEQDYMNQHNIKQGWFGYLWTNDNQIKLPLYQGYSQWILNAGFGEVPTPNAKIGENTFCVAAHEYLVDGAYSNYGFSQLQFETHKGEIVHVDAPDGYRYNYEITNFEKKTAQEGSRITANNYGKDVLHENKPVMMMYTCWSPNRFNPEIHPKYRYIVTSVLVNKEKINKKENKFYQQNNVSNQDKKTNKGFWDNLINKLNDEWLNLLFNDLKLQNYLELNDNGQGNM